MAFQLPTDCLNDIIEYLEQDVISLRSCLLVNRLWCTIAVRILWRDVWNIHIHYSGMGISLSVLSTLIACLPNESKSLLHESGIFIQTPTPKSPLFDYISFIKSLTFYKIEYIVQETLINHTSNHKYLVLQELLKAFM